MEKSWVGLSCGFPSTTGKPWVLLCVTCWEQNKPGQADGDVKHMWEVCHPKSSQHPHPTPRSHKKPGRPEEHCGEDRAVGRILASDEEGQGTWFFGLIFVFLKLMMGRTQDSCTGFANKNVISWRQYAADGVAGGLMKPALTRMSVSRPEKAFTHHSSSDFAFD